MAIIRRQHGHFLEDFKPGAVFRHKRGKTVTEGLFAIFTDFSMTTNPLSKNSRYAQAYGFRGLVVNPGAIWDDIVRRDDQVGYERAGRAGAECNRPTGYCPGDQHTITKK